MREPIANRINSLHNRLVDVANQIGYIRCEASPGSISEIANILAAIVDIQSAILAECAPTEGQAHG
jgi:hypothetical protein